MLGKISHIVLQVILIQGSNAIRGEDRIVGGQRIDITHVPYMLSFVWNGKHVCGASILNRYWGVTAAHCASVWVKDPFKEISIRSGSDLRDTGGIVHAISEITPHPLFNKDNSDYDIAVFRVEPPFEISSVTQPVKLPIDYPSTKTNWALVSGWGQHLEDESSLLQDLEFIILPKVDREVCQNDYKYRFTVTTRQVCYGFREGQKDACKGDSGDPLVNIDNVLVGITSWGDGCGEPLSPGVYTDVIILRDWIRNVTRMDHENETRIDPLFKLLLGSLILYSEMFNFPLF